MLKKLTLSAALVAAAAFLTPASAAPPMTQTGVAAEGAGDSLVQQVHRRHRHRWHHHRHHHWGYYNYYYPRYYYGGYPEYWWRYRHRHHRHHHHHHRW